jgi:methylated-DNA-[protein]-cysteine S-methyltransferase
VAAVARVRGNPALEILMNFTFVDTPIGEILVAGDADAIHEIHFAPATPHDDWTPDGEVLKYATVQLRSYFAGKRRNFDFPLTMHGTEFQRSVWNALRKIPYGETTTYGTLAQIIGRPDAVRAVGAANGANPIPIVVPCHRVIGSNGALTGFGGGIPVKRWLLDHEARVAGHKLF